MKLPLLNVFAGFALLFAVIALILTNTIPVTIKEFFFADDVGTLLSSIKKTIDKSIEQTEYLKIRSVEWVNGPLAESIVHKNTISEILTNAQKLSQKNSSVTNIIKYLETAKNNADTIVHWFTSFTDLLTAFDAQVVQSQLNQHMAILKEVKILANTLTTNNTKLKNQNESVDKRTFDLTLTFGKNTLTGAIIIIACCTSYFIHQIVTHNFTKNQIIINFVSIILAIGALSGGAVAIDVYTKIDDYPQPKIYGVNIRFIKAFNIMAGIFAILFAVLCILTSSFKLLKNIT